MGKKLIFLFMLLYYVVDANAQTNKNYLALSSGVSLLNYSNDAYCKASFSKYLFKNKNIGLASFLQYKTNLFTSRYHEKVITFGMGGCYKISLNKHNTLTAVFQTGIYIEHYSQTRAYTTYTKNAAGVYVLPELDVKLSPKGFLFIETPSFIPVTTNYDGDIQCGIGYKILF
jgi:hypothetical protein